MPRKLRPKNPSEFIPKGPGEVGEQKPRGRAAIKKIEGVRDELIERAFRQPGSAIVVTDMTQQQLERERSVLSQVLLEEKRALGRVDFWFFITQIGFPKTWERHYSEGFHRELCLELQQLKIGEDFWAFLPRKRRKSYIMTILHTAWLIVRDPNIRVLIIGAREETVKPFLRVLRSMFIQGTPGFEEFQRMYPEFMLQKGLRQAFQFEVPCRTVQLPDPTVRAAYLGVAGAGWRCDVLKFDDCIERRNVNNPEMSMKSLTQMMDLFPLIDDTGKYQNIIGAGTRWAYHDPYGRVLGEHEDGGQELFEVIERIQERKVKLMVRHAGEDPNRPCETCAAHIVRAYPHGHPTLADNAVSCDDPIHTMEHVRQDLARYQQNPQLGESLFWHQLMNVCMAPSEQRIRGEWFIQSHSATWPASKLRVLAVDSADKDFQKPGTGDWMVALMGEFDDWGRLLQVYGLRDRSWTRDQFIRKILLWCQATSWWPHKVVKEKFGGDTFLTDIRREFAAVDRMVHVIPISRPASLETGAYMKKLDWIVEALQAPLERAEIVFGTQFPPALFQRAQLEGTSLGQISNDDVIDCMALFMVPGVRLEAAPTRGLPSFPPAPPDLCLYTADQAQQASTPNMLSLVEASFLSPAVLGAGLELVERTTRLPPGDLGLGITLDY